MFVFQSLAEVREQTEQWLKEYNEERPHESLGDMTPREYLLTQKPEISSYPRISWHLLPVRFVNGKLDSIGATDSQIQDKD